MIKYMKGILEEEGVTWKKPCDARFHFWHWLFSDSIFQSFTFHIFLNIFLFKLQLKFSNSSFGGEIWWAAQLEHTRDLLFDGIWASEGAMF